MLDMLIIDSPIVTNCLIDQVLVHRVCLTCIVFMETRSLIKEANRRNAQSNVFVGV